MVGSDRDDLAVLAAWIDDHPTPPSEVRRILCDLIDGLAAAAADGLAAAAAEVPEATAASMAAARCHAVVPRVVRQSLPERTSGHRYLLELLTGEEPGNDDRVALERMIGLRSGRGGGLASMLGLGVEPADVDFLRTPEATRRRSPRAPMSSSSSCGWSSSPSPTGCRRSCPCCWVMRDPKARPSANSCASRP